MNADIIKTVATQGVFAVLFTALLIFVMNDNREREQRYLERINSLVESVKNIETIKNDISDIKLNIELIENEILKNK